MAVRSGILYTDPNRTEKYANTLPTYEMQQRGLSYNALQQNIQLTSSLERKGSLA